MHRLSTRWQKLPPKFRVFANGLLCLLCVFLIYITLGSPALSVRDAFRRQEKANFVGPSEILAQIRTKDMEYDHLVLAEDGTGVTIFTYDFWNDDVTELVYLPKSGTMTLAAVPGFTDLTIQRTATVPLVLFDGDSRASRAEVDLFLSGTFEGEFYEQQYSLAAGREYEGLFLFTIEASSRKQLWAEGYLLKMLQSAAITPTARLSDASATAQVRLYDAAGQLLDTQELILLHQS